MSFDARPPARRRIIAPLVVAMAMVGGLFALSSPGSAVTSDEAALASLVNGARAAAGLPPLALSGPLSDAARLHSAAMAASGTLYHSGGLAGSDWTRAGENVGTGDTVAEIHGALMASSSHRANILGDFNQLGVGVVRGSDGRLWATEVFVKTATAPVPAPTPEPTPVIVTEPVDTTVVTPSVLQATQAAKATPSAPRQVKAKAKGAARPARRASAARPAASECVPEHAQGRGHAYGRCDQVPQGQGQGQGQARGTGRR